MLCRSSGPYAKPIFRHTIMALELKVKVRPLFYDSKYEQLQLGEFFFRESDISEIPFVSVSKTDSVFKTESVCRSIGIFQVPYDTQMVSSFQSEISSYRELIY